MDNVSTLESLLGLLERQFPDSRYCQVPIPHQRAWDMAVGAAMAVSLGAGAGCISGMLFFSWPDWLIQAVFYSQMLLAWSVILRVAHHQEQARWHHWRKETGQDISNARQFREVLWFVKAQGIHESLEKSRDWTLEFISQRRKDAQAEQTSRRDWAVVMVASAVGFISAVGLVLVGPFLQQTGVIGAPIVLLVALATAIMVRSMWNDTFDRRSWMLKELYHVLGYCEVMLARRRKRRSRGPEASKVD